MKGPLLGLLTSTLATICTGSSAEEFTRFSLDSAEAREIVTTSTSGIDPLAADERVRVTLDPVNSAKLLERLKKDCLACATVDPIPTGCANLAPGKRMQALDIRFEDLARAVQTTDSDSNVEIGLQIPPDSNLMNLLRDKLQDHVDPLPSGCD